MIKLFEEFSKEPEVKVEYYDNGQKSEEWFLNGGYYREDGPARQKWYKNGQKMYEMWYLNGKIDREDGPAVQWWHKNGQKMIESWRLNGEFHKEDGPAIQEWYGQKEREVWCLNNKEYSREEWIRKLKEIGSEHYEEQKMLYDTEKYNL